MRYAHEETWHDDNGHAHVRASLLGPSLTVPFRDGRLLLGTWQQVVLLDFDTRPRRRALVVQLSGEREETS
jgi:secondary thiamine-phosphate synthase enzyme